MRHGTNDGMKWTPPTAAGEEIQEGGSSQAGGIRVPKMGDHTISQGKPEDPR
jgi:hypothetical protein